MTYEFEGTEIAIVGMAGRFPGAKNLEKFWANLRDGVESIRPITTDQCRDLGVSEATLQDPNFVAVNNSLDAYDQFDAGFFDYSPRDAEIIDPQQRVFLETCWHALEEAGFDPSQSDKSVGVYAGGTTSNYLIYNLVRNPEAIKTIDAGELDIGNGADFLATRVSYKFNLRGPSFSVQTACSTSLVAVHLACQALLGDECDVALAGGVSVHVDHPRGYTFVEGTILSPDGHCRPYDKDAVGTIFGGGAGVVVLKRLEDALAEGDAIHAVILGSAINNDGSDKVGFPAPGVDGQASVITEALAVADVDAETVQYLEGHGSGTRLGDPIEVRAVTKAFQSYTDQVHFGWMGSVKSNIGHLTGAAGIAGLIKTILALKHKQIPPSLHFNEPNPECGFDVSPFRPNPTLKSWPENAGLPRRAGVNSFGLGGTNAHVVLQEAPTVAPSTPSGDTQILCVSAKTPTALADVEANLKSWCDRHPTENFDDVAYSLLVGRKGLPHRKLLVRHGGEFVSELSHQSDRPPSVAFVFPENWSRGLSSDLLNSLPVLREALTEVGSAMTPWVPNLLALLDGDSLAERDATAVRFALSYAFARQWQAWGIHPTALFGLGNGEICAAVLSGMLSLTDGVRLLFEPHAQVPTESAIIPLLSASSGTWVGTLNGYAKPSAEALDNALNELMQDPQRQILIMGSAETIPAPLAQLEPLLSHGPDQSDAALLRITAAKLWLYGGQPDWQAVYKGEKRNKVSLPLYPFERKRYWIEASAEPFGTAEKLYKKPDLADWFYTQGWRSLPPSAHFSAENHLTKTWLILDDGNALASNIAATLRGAGHSVTSLNRQHTIPQIKTKVAEIGPDNIVNFWHQSSGDGAFDTLIALTQASTEPTQIDVVISGAASISEGERLVPELGVLVGAAHVANQEMGHLTVRIIDVANTNSQTLLAQLADSNNDLLTALRGRQRWVRTFDASPLASPPSPQIRLVENGTYVVTGGASDIGRDLVNYLAQRVSRVVVLDEDLAGITPSDQIEPLECRLDDGDQLKNILANLPNLKGVIHAPSVEGAQAFRPISDLTPDESEETFRLKINSLTALADATSGLKLDFCVVCSALSTALGGVGFAAFTAAAHVANLFVQQQNQTSTFPWLSIGWDIWQVGGDAAPLAVLGDVAALALTPDDGGQVLERALAAATTANVLVSTGNLATRMAQSNTKQSDRTLYERPDMWNEYVAPRDDVEEKVVAIWEQVLGIQPIGINDNFFDLGGHSLLATQLRNHLHNEFAVDLALQSLFEDATAAGVSQVIATSLAAGEADQKPILERLAEAFPNEREAIVGDYLQNKLSKSLNVDGGLISAETDLSQFDRQLATVDLMWHVKRDLKLQLYPHEILGAHKLPDLTQFVYTQVERMRNLPSFATRQPLSAYQLKPHGYGAEDRFSTPNQKNDPLLFVLSSPRSGSTLFRVMLAGHSKIFCPPEISLLFFEDMQQWSENVSFGQDFQWPAEGLHWALVESQGLEPEAGWDLIDQMVAENRSVQSVYAQIQANSGGRLVVDKTPPYAMDAATLHHAEDIFDGAKYIHLVRHPYAMIESFLRVRLDQQFSSSLFEEANPDPYIVAETIWATANRNLTNFLQTVDPARHILVRYEDVVAQPEQQMRRVCDFLGLPFEPGVITPYDGKRERMMGGIGDPNILNHTGIDPKLGDVWRTIELPRYLDPATQALATQLGYELPDNVVLPETSAAIGLTPESSTSAAPSTDDMSDDEVAAMLSKLLAQNGD